MNSEIDRRHFGGMALIATFAGLASAEGPARGQSTAGGGDLKAMVAASYPHFELKLPASRLAASDVIVPPSAGKEPRGRPFTMLGIGAGEAFAADIYQDGTIIEAADPGRPALRFAGIQPKQGAGSVEWGKQRVAGRTNGPVPLVQVDGLAGINHLHDFVLFQASGGDGLAAKSLVTSTVERFVALNSDWAHAPERRTGTGVRLTPDLDFGLAYIANSTCRGFDVGYQIGEERSQRLFATKLAMPEASMVRAGIVVASTSEGLHIDTPYFEGVTQTAISDGGRATLITAPYAVLEFATAIDLRGQGGTVIGGYVGLRPDGATGIKLGGSDRGQFIFGAQILWGGQGKGGTATGYAIGAAADPLAFVFAGFGPSGAWRGGRKIDDASFSTAHGGKAGGHGSGVFGHAMRETGSGQTLPSLSRVALNLHVDDYVLTEEDVRPDGVLRLSAASVQRLKLQRDVRITGFAAPNLPDKTGILVIEDGHARLEPSHQFVGLHEPVTFAAGELAVLSYQVLPGPAAPVIFTAIHRTRQVPAMPTIALKDLPARDGPAAGPVLVTDGRKPGEAVGRGTGCPAWFDGKLWRRLSDDTPIEA